VQRHLKLPIGLTHAGLIAERVTQAFWPFWTVLFFAIAPLLMGWHELVAVRGLQWPTQDEAVARVDSRLPGRPIAALNDVQAIGAGDAASEAIWSAHLTRMAEKTYDAKAVEPDLRVSSADPFGLRYVGLLFLIVALLFGSIWRIGTVADAAAGGDVLATGPVWEGWIEPPSSGYCRQSCSNPARGLCDYSSLWRRR